MSLKGRKQSAEHIRKRNEAKAKHYLPRWEKDCIICGKHFSVRHGLERVKCCSFACSRKSIRDFSGENNPNWKNGCIDKDGYHIVRRNNVLVRVHREIIEQKIGRKLKKNEIVHHWDENKSNNDPDNLCLMRSRAAHNRLHGFADRNNMPILALKFSQSWY